MSKKYLALVKWTSGKDTGKYTVGIDVTHIKQFNVPDFQTAKFDPKKIWTVEWHDVKNEPLGGWVCYPAMVIQVSDSLAVLNRTLTVIDGIPSPIRSMNQIKDSDSDIIETLEINDDKNKEELILSTSKKRLRYIIDSDEDDIDDLSKLKAKHLKDADGKKKEQLKLSELIPKEVYQEVPGTDFTNVLKDEDESKIDLQSTPKKYDQKRSESSTSTLEEQLEDSMTENKGKSDVNLKSVSKLQGKNESNSTNPSPLKKERKKSGFNKENDASRSTAAVKTKITSKSNAKTQLTPKKIVTGTKIRNSSSKTMMEIYEDTGVMIPKPIWLSALGKKSFTAMTTALLPAVFSPDELLNSNVHGGVSRVNKNAQRKTKLDEDKLNAIRLAVQEQWSTSYNGTQFNTTVNGFCSKVSSRSDSKE